MDFDSLEDWVAIKERPFSTDNTQRKKLKFEVLWNHAESKIAVKCRGYKTENGRNSVISEWQGTYSFTELRSIHEQLSLIHPSLNQYCPQFPVEPTGLWAYVTNAQPADIPACEDIAHYLNIAHDICGDALLINTLFEEHDVDEYFEKISELRRRAFDDAVSRIEEQLDSVLFLFDGCVNMLELQDVYKQEDEVPFLYRFFSLFCK